MRSHHTRIPCSTKSAHRRLTNASSSSRAAGERRKGKVRSAVSSMDPTVNASAPIMPPWSSTYPMALAPTTDPKAEDGVAAGTSKLFASISAE